jgi:adhesin/invasin
VSTSVAIAPAALVTDAGGNPVPGVNVTFAVASGGGSATGLTATTDGNGIAAAGSWRLGTTAGTNTLTATSGALSGSPVTFTATAKAGSATKLIVSTGDLTPAAGSSVMVGAQLADQYGNPVKAADVPVTWSRTGATGSASTTDSDGLASYAFTAGQTAGTLCSVSATGTGLTSGSVDLTVVAAAASSMTLVSGTDGQTATVGTAVANDPAVKVTDPYGNPVSGASVTFSVASGGGSVDGAGHVTRTTGADGVATVTAWTLGTTAGADNNTLTAASGDLTSRTFTATGRAGAATQLIATTPVTSPSALAKSTLFTVTAQLADQYGNSVSTAGVTVNWSKSSSSYSFVPSTPTNSKTDETGKATITLRSASSSSRSCTVTGASTGLVSDSVLVTT